MALRTTDQLASHIEEANPKVNELGWDFHVDRGDVAVAVNAERNIELIFGTFHIYERLHVSSRTAAVTRAFPDWVA